MATFIDWPSSLLVPSRTLINDVPFTRGGGRSLGGRERVVRTDKGHWRITLGGILVHSVAQRRTWEAIRTALSGRAGLISVPAWSFDTAPWSESQAWSEQLAPVLSDHSDGSPFSDGSHYSQGHIHVEAAATAPVGSSTIKLRRVAAADDLVGVRFSYKHALYKTGPVTSLAGDVWTVSLFPSIRQEIPADAVLNFDLPTCLVRLEEDNGMDIEFNINRNVRVDVNFVEADDYWSDLAAEEAA